MGLVVNIQMSVIPHVWLIMTFKYTEASSYWKKGKTEAADGSECETLQ